MRRRDPVESFFDRLVVALVFTGAVNALSGDQMRVSLLVGLGVFLLLGWLERHVFFRNRSTPQDGVE